MNILPTARSSDILVQHFNSETLVYDLLIDKAYCLNETAGTVFNACGSQSSFNDLKRQHKFSDEMIFFALDELKKINLLAKNDKFTSPFAGMTRRDVIRKVGLSSMIALPLISGLIAPTAANAASGAVVCGSIGNFCTCTNGDSGSCGQGRAIQCPANCTCFLPPGFGTCTSGNCSASCG